MSFAHRIEVTIMNKLLYDLFVFLCVYLDTLCYSMNLVFDELRT